MAGIERIRTSRNVHAMVALDNFALIEARIRKLLSYGRRIAMTQRYTWINDAPELKVGLLVNTEAHGSGIVSSRQDDGAHLSVYLRPGITAGFGISAYASDGNATEAEAWKRFHAAKSESANYFERRRRMTEIVLTGGMEGDAGPARDDLIVIRAWNDDGVCNERVIAFDTEAYWAAIKADAR